MKSSELRKAQKNLIDEFILSPDKIDNIIGVYKSRMKGFHDYSLGNLVLANWELFSRNGETIERLASYRLWQKKNRYVRKGEKALYILAPRFKEIKDDVTGEVIDKIMYFVNVPVFDISQTDGEPLELDYTCNYNNICFNEIKSRVVGIPIKETNKQLERGYTDGKGIWVSNYISDTRKVCTLLHELGHYKLHFGEDRKELTKDVKELEAEVISYMVSSYLGIVNDESSMYIKWWAGENAPEMIKGRGQKLIDTAMEIIEELHLEELVVEKEEELENWKQMTGYLTSRFMEWDTVGVIV